MNIFSVLTYLIFLKRGLKLPLKQIVHHLSLSHSPSHVSPLKSSQIFRCSCPGRFTCDDGDVAGCAELPCAWLGFQRALIVRNVVLAEVSWAVEWLAACGACLKSIFLPEEMDEFPMASEWLFLGVDKAEQQSSYEGTWVWKKTRSTSRASFLMKVMNIKRLSRLLLCKGK